MKLQDLDALQAGDILRYRWDSPNPSNRRLFRVVTVHPSSHELGAYLALIELFHLNNTHYLTKTGALCLAEKWLDNTLALFLPDLTLAPVKVSA